MADGFIVRKRPCETCIFSSKSPLSPERFEEYKRKWAAENTVQECHHSTIAHGNVACRGHYNAAQKGEIPHPVPQIMAEFYGIAETATAFQVAMRLGFIQFTEDDSYHTEKEDQSHG